MAGIDLAVFSSRFRGHAEALNALWRAFHDRPAQPLTVAQLVDITGLSFEAVHQHLTQTPELFYVLPKKPNTNTQYRLSIRVERKTPEAVAAYIDAQGRSEARVKYALMAAIVGLVTALAVVTALA